MILFLRNNKNETIVDVEIYVKKEDGIEFVELRSVVVIETYSKFLLDNIKMSDDIIDIFQVISELRGYMWEDYFATRENNPSELKNVVNYVSEFLKDVGNKFNLKFVTD